MEKLLPQTMHVRCWPGACRVPVLCSLGLVVRFVIVVIVVLVDFVVLVVLVVLAVLVVLVVLVVGGECCCFLMNIIVGEPETWHFPYGGNTCRFTSTEYTFLFSLFKPIVLPQQSLEDPMWVDCCCSRPPRT